VGYVKRLVFLLILLPGFALGQEMWGIVNSNFAGSNSALSNPSLLNSSKLYLDVNLITVDVFAQNNFAYLPAKDFSLLKLLKSNYEVPAYGAKEDNFIRYDNSKVKTVQFSVLAKGPSAMLIYNDHAFAFHTAVRSISSINRVPYEITNFGYFGFDYKPQWNINYIDHDFSLAAMAWGEIGLTYSKDFYKYGFNQWTAGLTLKYLLGFSGAYVDVHDIDYVVLNDSTLDIRNLNADAGFSLPIDYNDGNFPAGKTIKGRGLGLDFGVTYTRTQKGHSNQEYRKLCQKPYRDYIFRMGASILDFGGIKFKDQAQKHSFDNVDYFWERIDTLGFDNINAMVMELSERFYGSPDASLEGSSFRMALPTALSLQFDYHYYKNFYVGANLIAPIGIKNNYLKRPAQLAVTPRYESYFFELALPISLYQFTQPRVGLSARLYFFTIGTEKLGSIFGMSDFTGTDLYFSIKINLRKGHCKEQKSTHCTNGEYKSARRKY
jgi:Family of unknown function (DUF5723)